MRLLIDECLPQRVKFLFAEAGHDCQTVREAGLSGEENGELLAAADGKFDVLLTIDKNIRHQQSLAERKIAILIIRPVSSDLEDIRPHVPAALRVLRTVQPGQFAEVGIDS